MELEPLGIFITIFFVLPLAIWASSIARKKGKTPGGWFFVTLILPISIVFILLADYPDEDA
jgi:hypothetical protein